MKVAANTILIICLLALLASCSTTLSVVDKGRSDDRLPQPLEGFVLSDLPAREMPGWRKPERILVTLASMGITDGLEQELEGIDVYKVPGFAFTEVPSGPFDVILSMCSMPSNLRAINNTHWVHSYSVGIEGCLADPKIKNSNDLLLTNSRGASASTIAEHAIALMFSLGRNLPLYQRNMLEQHWASNGALPRENFWSFEGKTVLVLGLGSIGREAARRAHGLGMRVIATRNSRREGPNYVDYVGLSHEALALAAQADVVINALPFTPATQNLVDAEFFHAMPTDALFINVGRGGTVDTAALVSALENNIIGGAGLDVVNPEPLPKTSPLWGFKNVIITPHVAAMSNKSLQLTRLIAQENLRRYIAGDRLINFVNRENAY